MYMMTLRSGAHVRNCICHALIVDNGTTTRNGPYCFWVWNR